MVIAMASIFASCSGGASGQVHECAGAGRWFPAKPTELRSMIEQYLDAAATQPLPGRVAALVAPHAGYPYSGPVAAYSYAAVRGKSYDRVLILAFSHTYMIEGLSVLDAEAYKTPLGAVPVDRDCVKALLKREIVHPDPKAHMHEHSDENQLPFLQVALKPGWKMVSVFVGHRTSEAELNQAIEALRPCLSSNTLVVVSSDFTHIQQADRDQQNEMDLEAARLLVAKDYDRFIRYVQGPRATICGQRPLSLLLRLLGPNAKGRLLKHRTSGEMSGDYSYSVGYCSIVYTVDGGSPWSVKSDDSARPKEPGVASALDSDHFLTAAEEKALLKLARRTLVEWVTNHSRKFNLAEFALTPKLKENAGAFVTLHERGHLRGCIGYIEPIKPLHQTIMENACNAATSDYRFPTVQAKELPDIDIEISVMSPLRKIAKVDEIVVGKHGLLIKKGINQGVFLPQVPVEQKWNRDQYLEAICRKAYLSPGSWRDAELFVFTAQVFGEKESSEAVAGK
jgi:hypothetical protein